MGYKQEYYKLIEKLLKNVTNFYKERLISLALFGSVAKDTFRPDSDIDFLIIAENLPKGRTKRIIEFLENVESTLSEDLRELSKIGINPYFSAVIKSPEEIKIGSPLFLDMIEDVKILYDKDKFFENYLLELKEKLKNLGSKKIYFKGGYYWLLKPDYKPGDIIEL